MREKTLKYHHYKQKLCHKYSLVKFEPSGTVVQCLGLQGHLGQLEPPGNIQRSTDTSGMTLWHAGTLVAHLICWHSRQTHGTDRLMMAHHSLNLGRLYSAHTDDVVGLQDG